MLERPVGMFRGGSSDGRRRVRRRRSAPVRNAILIRERTTERGSAGVHTTSALT